MVLVVDFSLETEGRVLRSCWCCHANLVACRRIEEGEGSTLFRPARLG